MQIKSEIIAQIEASGLSVNDSLSLLLSIHFDCVPSYVPHLLLKQLEIAKLITIDSQMNVSLNVELFEKGAEDLPSKWQWVAEWRNMFKEFNPARSGNLKTCITRMKVFFSENPGVRIEDVIEATRLYMHNVTDAQYLMTAHKFIYDGAGRSRNSTLEEWVEKYYEQQIREQISARHISDQML